MIHHVKYDGTVGRRSASPPRSGGSGARTLPRSVQRSFRSERGRCYGPLPVPARPGPARAAASGDEAVRLPGYIASAEPGHGWIGHLVARYHVQGWVQRNTPKLAGYAQSLARRALTAGIPTVLFALIAGGPTRVSPPRSSSPSTPRSRT